jgi:hypothetical protein
MFIPKRRRSFLLLSILNSLLLFTFTFFFFRYFVPMYLSVCFRSLFNIFFIFFFLLFNRCLFPIYLLSYLLFIRQGQQIFLYPTASGPPLGPTQPPIQWVPRALSPRVKRQGHEADHSTPFNAQVMNGLAIPPLHHTPS